VTAIIFIIAVGTGTVVGWLLTMTTAAAAMSRSQAHMERKVRYWQAEANRAHAEAAQLADAVVGQSR
jgi:hypothetical protein